MLNKNTADIYAITPDRPLILKSIEAVIKKHKIGILQYRRKINNKYIKLNEAKQLQLLCTQNNILFIINDDIDLAKKLNANGVHLGKNDTTIKKARKTLGNNAIIGVSCYNNINKAIYAEAQGANYIAFGSLFTSSVKPYATHCTLSTIKCARKKLQIPIVGIGGINFSNKQKAKKAGCDLVAMITALFSTSKQFTTN